MSREESSNASIALKLEELSAELESMSKSDLADVVAKLRASGLSPEAIERLVKVSAKAGEFTVLAPGQHMGYHY